MLNAGGRGTAVVVCDHASNAIPRSLGTLGLGPDDLVSHIAWDPGAAEVARRLAVILDAPLVLSGYSRLVVDCNRPLASGESMPTESGGVAVPGNRDLSAAARAARIGDVFEPYHRAIAEVLDLRTAARRPSVLLSVHSFTPILRGDRRPWNIGVSGRGREGLTALLVDRLSATARELTVGHNQPYAIEDDSDYTIPVHGERRGLPNALIEIRQDGLTTPEDWSRWAELLATAYRQSETPLPR